MAPSKRLSGALLLLCALTGSAAHTDPGPKWRIDIEGLPTLSGANVMPLNIGDIRKSNLLGANAIVNLAGNSAATKTPGKQVR